MARRQTQIPGTERPVHPELEEAADELADARTTRKTETKRLTEAEKTAEAGLIALMKSRGIHLYKFHDNEGEEVEIELEQVWKVHMRKTGDAEPDVGDEVEASGPPANEVHDGLIAQAERAMAENGVAETPDGDVVTPDAPAPKAKKPRKGGGKKRGK